VARVNLDYFRDGIKRVVYIALFPVRLLHFPFAEEVGEGEKESREKKGIKWL